MKIAFVYDALFPFVKGGGERRYAQLAECLRERHDIHLVSWQYWEGAATRSLNGVTYHGTGPPPALYGRDGRRRTGEALDFALRALPVLVREDFDVIDCASVPFLPLLSAAAASRLRHTALVATWFEFWGPFWYRYLGSARGRIARIVERAAAEVGDVRIAISHSTAQRLPAARLREVATVIIEPGIDTELIRRVPFQAKTVDLVFAGRLTSQKNVPLLLRAIALARDDGARLTCDVVGEGPELASLQRLADELRIADLVRFRGRIDDDNAYYAAIKAARLFAWPSVAEGFGLAPLEAMACGVPPVIAASPFSATQRLAGDGEFGVVTAPEPVSFSRVLRDLLADRDTLASLSAAAMRRAERSTLDDMARAVERVYMDVASRRGSATPMQAR